MFIFAYLEAVLAISGWTSNPGTSQARPLLSSGGDNWVFLRSEAKITTLGSNDISLDSQAS